VYIPVLLYVVIIYNQFFPIFYPVLQADLIRGYELDFLIDIGLSLLAGFLIGAERESRGKPAGISTHCFVIGGSMIFTYLSAHVDPNSSSRIAAQLVSGIGFLGAGIILKSEADERITNLTTAAAIWFAASIGMAIGFNFYFMAIVAIAFAVLVPRIPHISKLKSSDR
jgi:putative Mg2+ transporter-C (MgtC) family protein